jgi:hypothetical protein
MSQHVCPFPYVKRMKKIYFCGPGLQINDIEPFCQDEIVLYQKCVAKRVSYINPSEAAA